MDNDGKWEEIVEDAWIVVVSWQVLRSVETKCLQRNEKTSGEKSKKKTPLSEFIFGKQRKGKGNYTASNIWIHWLFVKSNCLWT